MKRIGELTIRWNSWRPRRRPSALWGGGGRGDEAATSRRPAAGLRRLGHGSHDLRPARRAAAGKASGTEARDPDGAAGGDRSRPGGIALGFYRKVWLGFGSVATSGLPPPDAREQSALAPLPPNPGEIITMPRTSCGAPMAFGCSRWTTAGAGSRRRALERRVCRLACLQAGDLQPISMGLAGLYGRPRPARLGGWPCGWITAPSIPTSPTRFWVQPSYAGRPTASPSGSIAR